MIVGMTADSYEKKIVANEWDGCWFCDDCYCLKHWKEEAYIVDGRPHCRNCAEEHARKGER